MSEVIKICKKHGELIKDHVYINKKGIKICRFCIRETAHSFRCQHREEAKEASRKWRVENKEYYDLQKQKSKERDRVRAREYYHVHKEVYKKYKKTPKAQEATRIYEKKLREKLSDKYVKKTLTKKSGLRTQDIPQSLIEAKRAILMLKRELKKDQA